MTDEVFNARRVQVLYCKSPECRSVHIHLLDADDVVRSQACIAVENIDELIGDLRIARSAILAGGIRVTH
jgi:hypothetical protein